MRDDDGLKSMGLKGFATYRFTQTQLSRIIHAPSSWLTAEAWDCPANTKRSASMEPDFGVRFFFIEEQRGH
jgi:hypothetical protein